MRNIGLLMMLVVGVWSMGSNAPRNPEVFTRGILWGVAVSLWLLPLIPRRYFDV